MCPFFSLTIMSLHGAARRRMLRQPFPHHLLAKLHQTSGADTPPLSLRGVLFVFEAVLTLEDGTKRADSRMPDGVATHPQCGVCLCAHLERQAKCADREVQDRTMRGGGTWRTTVLPLDCARSYLRTRWLKLCKMRLGHT